MLSQYGVVLELLSQMESIFFLLTVAGTLLTRVKGYAGMLAPYSPQNGISYTIQTINYCSL